jgi:hypothetical protein
MHELRRRLRAAIEHVLPWFDRAAENRWRVGFERDLASSRATRAHAEREIGRQERRWSLSDIPRRYERYDDAVRGS